MNALPKVLVVDSGQRGVADLLSTELAELGLSSVTTSLEATEQVLDVIERPSAIVIHMPAPGQDSALAEFQELAAALRASDKMSGVPVIEWRHDRLVPQGGLSSLLRTEVGPQAVAGPEL